MNATSHDLNLLRTLLVLLETQSATQTAERLGKTQPAVSQSLSRLRDLFDDPLFVREGQKLAPTAKALSLHRPLAIALESLENLLGEAAPFDAQRSSRQFIVICPDFYRDSLLQRLRPALADAPNVQLQFQRPSGDSLDRLTRGDCDLVILEAAPTLVTGTVIAEPGPTVEWGVFCRANHPYARRLALENWRKQGHIEIQNRDGRRGPVDDYLARRRLRRKIRVIVSEYTAALSMAAQTDFLFTAPSAQVSQSGSDLAEQIGLWVLPAPMPLPSITLAYHFNRQAMSDDAGAWFKRMLLDIG